MRAHWTNKALLRLQQKSTITSLKTAPVNARRLSDRLTRKAALIAHQPYAGVVVREYRRDEVRETYEGVYRICKALSGEWKGHRSSRLSIQYRVIYRVVASSQLFQVVSITAHDYRRP